MDDSGEQTRKLFLGGLNYATTEESLTTYFSEWGTLVDVVVMRFPDSRRSRGFGFITYSSTEEAEACFAAGPHSLDGTKIDLKKATPKDEKAPPGVKGEVLRKVFVGGLSYTTTDEGLRSYFEKFGEIVDCVVMKYKDSDRSRGFGFVTFSSTDMVDSVQQNRPHEIDGTKVETKRATPREESGKGETGKSVQKIFIGGLKDEISDEDLTQYFSQFGNVVTCEQMVDKATGRKRGFGFIEFDDYDSVDKALLVQRHEVSGHKVDIRKALGKNELGQMKDGGFGGGRGFGGRGGGRGGGREGGRGGGHYPWGGANQGGYGGGYGDGYSGYGGTGGGWGGYGAGANPWQGGGASSWGSDQSSGWGSAPAAGNGYMTSGGGWGGGYQTGGTMGGGAMRNSMMGNTRPAPYSIGRGGAGAGRGAGAGAGGAPAGPRW